MNGFYFNTNADFIFAKDGEDKAPELNISVYNGGLLRLGNYSYPVVLDLKGIKARPGVPVLIDHTNSADSVLGQGDVAVTEGQVMLAGRVTGRSKKALEIIDTAKAGHRYQASIGAAPLKSMLIEEGESEKVNGREFNGPFVLVKQSEVLEVSVVAIGADRDGTDVDIAAIFGFGISQEKGNKMDPKFIEWVKATYDLDAETLTEAQREKLTAAYVEATKEPEPMPVDNDADRVAVLEAKLAESDRVSAIKDICGSEFGELQDKAVKGGWTPEQVTVCIAEVKAVRASRPAAPAIIAKGEGVNKEKTIEAAMVTRYGSLSDEKLTATYGEETLDRAEKLRRMTLKETIRACCAMDGVPEPRIGATPAEWVNAAYSTGSFPSVLLNSANKILQAAYAMQESAAVQVAQRLNANDFKTHTGVRMSAGGNMAKVVNGGEIQHGTVEDENFTYAVDTYAELIGLTRQDIINDDLGAFMRIPRQIAFDAWQLRENLFFTLLLANTGSFFDAGNNNLLTGAGSALSVDGLNAAIAQLRKQVDQKGRAIDVRPEIMLVPPELEATADGFFSSEMIVVAGASDVARTDRNVHRAKYRPVGSPFLSNSAITGYSATAWYLFANPETNPAFGIAYLGGNETPTIEEVANDPRYLGRTWRGYYDLGVCQIDKRGAQKNAGA